MKTVGRLDFGDTNNTHNITIAAGTGGGSLNFDAGGVAAQLNSLSGSANNTISAPITLSSSLNITNASSTNGNLTLSGGITAATAGAKTITTSTGLVTVSGVIGNGSGTIGLTQNGPGTLALTQVNTYSGNTTIAGGTISVDGDATLGTGTLFLSGGTLNGTATRSIADAIANNINVTANSSITTSSAAGTVLMNFTGTLSGTAGTTLTFNNTGADMASDMFTPRFSGGDFTMDSAIVLTSALGQVQLQDFNASGTTHTFNGVISGNGSFNRSFGSGTGGTTVFTVSNTYTGTTTVNNGTLQLGNGGTTGALSTLSAITINTAGTFAINRSNAVTQGTDFANGITGAGRFLQAGTGTTTLNVANAYSGGTLISGGTLVATVGGALGTGNVSLTAGNVTLSLGNGGVAQDYIADTATLSIGFSSDIVNLNYTGTDTIASLVIAGAQQAAGTYGGTGSGAQNILPEFTGMGTLTVIPEPATYMLMGLGVLICAQAFRRKRS